VRLPFFCGECVLAHFQGRARGTTGPRTFPHPAPGQLTWLVFRFRYPDRDIVRATFDGTRSERRKVSGSSRQVNRN
jgi:hypothetical protein